MESNLCPAKLAAWQKRKTNKSVIENTQIEVNTFIHLFPTLHALGTATALSSQNALLWMKCARRVHYLIAVLDSLCMCTVCVCMMTRVYCNTVTRVPEHANTTIICRSIRTLIVFRLHPTNNFLTSIRRREIIINDNGTHTHSSSKDNHRFLMCTVHTHICERDRYRHILENQNRRAW